MTGRSFGPSQTRDGARRGHGEWGHPRVDDYVESQGEALGGSEERARKYFARAVDIQRGLSPIPYVALATGVVKSKQDREEFSKLMEQALAIDPEKDPSHRLVTLIAQRRARVLLDRIDDLFLEPGPRLD